MAQTADAPKPTWTFALHGFVSATGGYQTGTFSPAEGQLSNYATTAAASATNPGKDKGSFTFDVRHSRFNFSVKGPQSAILGATPTGILEIDFMGGFGAGANGNTSLLNRLRVAVAELAWPGTKLQFGQQNDLIFAMAPTSLSHIGQPIGYGTGNIGFRRPGAFGYHTLSLAKDLSVELAWEIGRASWNDAGTSGVTTPSNGISAAEASGSPAFEGRATVNYAKLLNVWVAGHQHRVDLTGVQNVATPTNAGASPAGPLPQTLTVATLNGGFKATVDVAPIAITLAGTGFVAQNAGTLSGNLGSGFAFGPRGNQNVDSSGYWAQLGLNLTKEFSLWGFYGQQWVAKQDFVFANGGDAAAAAGKAYENTTTNVIAMYRDASGIALSLEWINFATKYPKDAAAIDAAAHKITASRTARADQYLATVNYFF